MKNSEVRLDLRKNLGDSDMTSNKFLERELNFEAVTRNVEEDNEPRVSAIQSKENPQQINTINDPVRILRTNQSNRQVNQKILKSEAKNILRGNERSSRETGDINRNFNS